MFKFYIRPANITITLSLDVIIATQQTKQAQKIYRIFSSEGQSKSLDY
jgi:hypothetical protein